MAQLKDIQRRIEAILFASGEPIETKRISQVLEVEPETVENLVHKLKDRYTQADSAIDILILEDSFQMCTRPEHADYIRAALTLGRTSTISNAALEVLAVVAYNQPVTRAFIEEVRGVDCSNLVRGLVEKDLIEEAGRLNVPGRPIVYKTTATFLRSFSLDSLDQLPLLPDTLPDEDEDTQVEGQMDFYSRED